MSIFQTTFVKNLVRRLPQLNKVRVVARSQQFA
jgi:hypothetical protein